MFGKLEPDSAEVVVEVDDSKEKDVAGADDDDDSDEAKNDLSTDDDSKEGIRSFTVWIRTFLILNNVTCQSIFGEIKTKSF